MLPIRLTYLTMAVIFQSVKYPNGVNVMCLKKFVSKTEPSALMYKLPTALLNGQSGLNGLTGVSVHTIQLETACR